MPGPVYKIWYSLDGLSHHSSYSTSSHLPDSYTPGVNFPKMTGSSNQEDFPADRVTEPVAPDLGVSFQSAASELEDNRAGAFDDAYRVGWDGENDPMSPRSMSTTRKWMMVLIVCMATVCVYVSDTVSHLDLYTDTHSPQVHVQVLSTQPPTIRSNATSVHRH